MKKRATLLSLVLASSALLTACSDTKDTTKKPEEKKDTTAPTKTAPKQVLNLVETAEPPSLDSAKTTDSVSYIVLNNVLEGLVRADNDGNLVDGMADAKTIEKSEDGKTYTFHLRDAKWSNGESVTANDFVYAWRRVVDPKTASEYAFIMYDIKNAEAINKKKMPVEQLGVTAVDDKTLKVELANPIPYFLSLTTFFSFLPANEKFVTAQGDKYGLEAGNLLANGPFVLDSWKHEDGWVYKKNPGYWDQDKVKLEEINVKVVKDVSTAVNLYDTGKVDYTAINSDFVDKFKGKPEFHTLLDPRISFLRFNLKSKTQPAMANVNFRKALSMSFDKEAMATTILNDGSEALNGLVPKGYTKGPDGKDFRETNGDLLVYNLEEAKKYWEQAKKELGKDNLTMEFLSSDSDSDKKIGEYLKGQWEQNLLGITVDIKQVPFKQRLDLVTKLDYEMVGSGWGPDYQDPMTFVELFYTPNPFNNSGWNNPEYDKLITGAKTTLMTDLQKRWDAMLQAEKILFETPPIVPTIQKGISYVQRENVKDIGRPINATYTYKWTHIE